ncbi:MAG: DnaJ domain-containing protein [Nostocaceae cyanobacterium]|nr:DnaJ domain-containing protein [Nostocaceae cyanobacterium]
MLQTFLPSEWLKQLADPYAVLGISVTATEREILKRYHSLAKLLHPDRQSKGSNVDKELVTSIFTRLINPAYQQLKHTKIRAQTIATLRSQASNLETSPSKALQTDLAKEMIKLSALEAELFYEQAIASLASAQYQSLEGGYQVTQQLSELNLVYLYLHPAQGYTKQEEATQNIPSFEETPEPSTFDQATYTKPVVTNYAQRHYQRGVQYAKQANWKLAVLELRDAIKLEPYQSDYHALLGLIHFKQKFYGMARVYIRQALKLNPQNRLALKYAPMLEIKSKNTANPPSIGKAVGIAALLSKFLDRKRS